MTSELADLEHYLDVANKANFHGLPGKTKAEALLAVSRMRNKLDALDVAVITAFEATKEHVVEGHASCIGWLQHHSRDHGDPAALRRRLARRVRALPHANRALLAEGTITARHIDVLDKARREVGDDAFALAEQALVDAAVVRRFSDFAGLVNYFIHEVGPRDADQREQQRFEDRYGSSSRTLDGDGKIDAWMPAFAFTVWQDELERLMETEYQNDVAEAHDRLGRRPLASSWPAPPANAASTPWNRWPDAPPPTPAPPRPLQHHPHRPRLRRARRPAPRRGPRRQRHHRGPRTARDPRRLDPRARRRHRGHGQHLDPGPAHRDRPRDPL